MLGTTASLFAASPGRVGLDFAYFIVDVLANGERSVIDCGDEEESWEGNCAEGMLASAA